MSRRRGTWKDSVNEEVQMGNWWNKAGGQRRMESRRKTTVLGCCQTEPWRERTDGHVLLFSAANAVFAKSDSFKIFLYGLEVQQGTVLRAGKEKILWSNCNSNKQQAEYCWIFNTLRSCLVRTYCSMELTDSIHFYICSGWLELENVLIDFFFWLS